MSPSLPEPVPADELPPLEIREYRPGDEHAVLATFNRVFAAVDPGFQPRSLAYWRWQFLENPSGWRMFLALAPDGSVVSQYAGLGQRVLLEGAPARFSQAVDSMTDPAWRRGLKKPGFFVLTGYPYASTYGGPPPDHDTVMWGLPVPAAWRIGKQYLKYELVRTQDKLVAPLERVALRDAAGVHVDEVEGFPEEVEALFRRAAAPHGAIAVRDRAQLDWRFVRCPERAYRIGLARRAGGLAGYAVFRKGAFDGVPGEGLVADWLVDPDDAAAGDALRAWLVDVARAEGAERLVALLPDTVWDWILYQKAGFRVRPTRYFLVGRNYVKRYTMRWLHDHWYYTLGDTDLV